MVMQRRGSRIISTLLIASFVLLCSTVYLTEYEYLILNCTLGASAHFLSKKANNKKKTLALSLLDSSTFSPVNKFLMSSVLTVDEKTNPNKSP